MLHNIKKKGKRSATTQDHKAGKAACVRNKQSPIRTLHDKKKVRKGGIFRSRKRERQVFRRKALRRNSPKNHLTHKERDSQEKGTLRADARRVGVAGRGKRGCSFQKIVKGVHLGAKASKGKNIPPPRGRGYGKKKEKPVFSRPRKSSLLSLLKEI